MNISKLNIQKLKKTFYVAFFVSLGAQIYVDLFVEGFIVALSVVMMAVFLYCYEELHPAHIILLSGVFSPLVRMVILLLQGDPTVNATLWAVPDSVFFGVYGIIYCSIYKGLKLLDKNIRTFPLVIAVCDFSANMIEMLVRQMIFREAVLELHVVKYLFLVAVVRTFLVEVILVAIESYSSLLLRQEHDAEYRRLFILASLFESELYIMDKGAREIESLMKKAYTLYRGMEQEAVPERFKDVSLDIAKDAHEIKNDYLRTIQNLKGVCIMDAAVSRLSIRDIAEILKTDMLAQSRKLGQDVEIIIRIKDTFYIERHFDMMSILRNLMLNSLEAIGKEKGRIWMTAFDEDEFHIIEIRDNGAGIDEKNMEYLFLPGFSTKYNEATGDMGRGIGLPLVRDYVETIFKGTISVASEKGVFSEFRIKIPKEAEGGTEE